MKIKFLTFNIFNGEFIERCIDFFKKQNPDIFVLQEVYKSNNKSLDKKYRSLQLLKREFANCFYYYSPAYFRLINGYKVDSGNAVFSKLKIIKKKTIFYYRQYAKRPAETVEQFYLTPRNLQCVTLAVGDTNLNVLNTQGVWRLDGMDNNDRLRMSKTIVEQIKGRKNVILAGDMNVSPKTRTIKNIEKHLVNVFKDKLITTFNMKQKIPFSQQSSFLDEEGVKAFASAVVDMIFVSPDIKVINHYCPQIDVSDHYPLVATLEV